MSEPNHNIVQRIVETFLKGNLSAMLVVLSLIAGGVALLVTPREEEPQIVVPMADVLISVPGASAREVERQVTTRLEKLLYQIDGVEYVYSMSRANEAIVTVRFKVGEDRERSLIKLYSKIQMNVDAVPRTVAGWVVKPVEIDDVPIVNITLHSATTSDSDLRRIAEEIEVRLQSVPNTGTTSVIGGAPRQVRIALDAERLASRGLTVAQLEQALRGANVTIPAGTLSMLDTVSTVDAGKALSSVEEVGSLVVGIDSEAQSPIYLRDLAQITDGPAERTTYTHLYTRDAERRNAVTIALAKKKGSNAVWVSRDIQKEFQKLAAVLLPQGVEWTVTRDYGHTANDKVNELVEGLTVAIVIVIALLALAMGWREALIVAAAVPVTFALTLLINYLMGYTINRVTLFALTLALGLVVDDPIVDVENIHRHLRMGRQKAMDAVLTAINEVRPPIILATLAVIVSFVPMFFITGMMGPYMRPMALNVPLSMLMSLLVAFTITPWLSYHVLKNVRHAPEGGPAAGDAAAHLRRSLVYRAYSRITSPFLDHRAFGWTLMLVMVVLFGLSCLLAATRRVPLKMLPFDNKNEIQVIIDMPEGTTLERTEAAAHAMAQYLRGLNEVTHVTSHVGTSSPMDFNGMVRHYYLRQGDHVADLRVNLIDKDYRQQQSHAFVLRIRPDIDRIAQTVGANVKLVEMPPGPPVISTITTEVYGQPFHDYADLQRVARVVESRFRTEPGVVDVDSSIEADQSHWIFVADKEKAALAGLSSMDIASALAAALGGTTPTSLHAPHEVNPTAIHIRLPREDRTDPRRLENLHVAAPGNVMVQLAEIGQFQQAVRDQTIYRKNLRPVVYVFGEMAGRAPAEAILDMQKDLAPGGISASGIAIPDGMEIDWAGEGEWKITIDVFRDLGLAFAAACLGIYVLLVYETGSYFMPVILMISIPLTVIGIMPGFWLLNLFTGGPVAGAGSYHDPVFFTATAMIGMIALSGIAVRNAILLIDFIHASQREGVPLRQAILDSGAVRLRPIFLTAGTAMLAAIPITLDPIFSGLAWALIFGLFVSTAFTLLVIPVVYWMIYANRESRPAANA